MQELEAFLNSIRLTYPFGIPRRLIDAVAVSQEKPQKLYLVGESLSDSGKALLMAAMEKGLKVSDYEIILVSTESALPSLPSYALIYFGTDEKINTALMKNSKAVIKTIHPDDVVKDPNLKREFWMQIQKIIPELNK